MTRSRILFVDDDVMILKSLRSVLRRDAARWDMLFVAGAEAALLEIRRSHFDIVISDMRMPGMNGAALLETIRLECPDMCRIMLSGSADLDDVERARTVAHELLSKPCPTNVIRQTIERWLAVP